MVRLVLIAAAVFLAVYLLSRRFSFSQKDNDGEGDIDGHGNNKPNKHSLKRNMKQTPKKKRQRKKKPQQENNNHTSKKREEYEDT